MPEKVKKAPIILDMAQKIIIAVATTLIISMITFTVVQIGKIGELERIIKELPSSTQTKKLDDILIELKGRAGAEASKTKMILFMLKEKGVLNESDIKIILGD
jgi:hypothetical protein